MKTLGILGGMSAESTLTYYQQINQQVHHIMGRNHGAKLLIVSVDFEDIVVMQQQGNWQQAGELLAHHAKNLELIGADGILLATNTMHKVASQIEQAITIPFLHLLDSTAYAIKKQGLTKVALLGTLFTMTDGFYQQRMADFGIEITIPNEIDCQTIHRIIFDELCCGQFLDTSKQHYLDIIHTLTKQGVEGVILGCTEIGLLIQPEDSPIPVFDSTAIHVEEAVGFLVNSNK